MLLMQKTWSSFHFLRQIEEPDSTATTSKPGVTASNTNEGKQDSKKKDGGKNRRHHSDINLAANVGQLLKVKDTGDCLDGLDFETVQVPEKSVQPDL
jgi:hypothetical protein